MYTYNIMLIEINKSEHPDIEDAIKYLYENNYEDIVNYCGDAEYYHPKSGYYLHVFPKSWMSKAGVWISPINFVFKNKKLELTSDSNFKFSNLEVNMIESAKKFL